MIEQNHIPNFKDFLSSHAAIEAGFNHACQSRKVSKGHIILSQGETGQDMFLLREGSAKVVLYSEGGHEVHLADFTSGTLFGEMAIILGAARSSNVVAQSDCSVDSISAKAFKELMRQFPELALYMTRLLAQRLQHTSQNLFESLAFTVPQRVYEDLWRRSEQYPNNAEIYRLAPVPSVTSLSEGLNVSREATSRAISKLTAQGLIKKQKAYWNIIRPQFKDY